MASHHKNLTVCLKREGGTLKRTFIAPPYGQVARSTMPWQQATEALALVGGDGLGALRDILEAADLRMQHNLFQGEHLTRLGEGLFTILMGAQDCLQWRGALRTAFWPDPGPDQKLPPVEKVHPERHPLRLRIKIEDEVLLGLPWQIAAYQSKPLVDAGWRFETTTQDKPVDRCVLRVPCRMLVVVSNPKDPSTSAHVTSLRERLVGLTRGIEPRSPLEVAHTRAGIKAASQARPQVIYFFGETGMSGGQCCLVLQDEAGGRDLVSMRDLRASMGEHTPAIVYLNAERTARPRWSCAGHQLGQDIPLVVARCGGVNMEASGRAAIDWLQDVLAGKGDPMTLLCRRPPDEGTSAHLHWATCAIHSHCDHWELSTQVVRARYPDPVFSLDRQDQRALVSYFLTNTLADDPDSRVGAMVAYASAGKGIETFRKLLTDWLKEEDLDTVHIVVHQDLAFPQWRSDLEDDEASARFASDLEATLRDGLGIGEREDMGRAFRERVSRSSASRITPVLWLDWGVFGPDPSKGHQPEPTEDQLAEWFWFCSDKLARKWCPGDIRVVSYLAMEKPPEEHGHFSELLAWFEDQEDLPASFYFKPIAALPDVKRRDIETFLKDSRKSSCPKDEYRQWAARIFKKTRGRYEQTAACIKEGERRCWEQAFGRELEGGPSRRRPRRSS